MLAIERLPEPEVFRVTAPRGIGEVKPAQQMICLGGIHVGGLSATAGKYIFTRVRPRSTDNPCLWFQGGSNYSFPSGEASVAAALVTPYVLEYGSESALDALRALGPLEPADLALEAETLGPRASVGNLKCTHI
jgi:hypothetical protein